MKARRRVEFTGVELATPVEKATTGLVKKATAARGAVVRKEDRLPRLGVVEMSPGRAEARWRGRCYGERGHRGGAA